MTRYLRLSQVSVSPGGGRKEPAEGDAKEQEGFICTSRVVCAFVLWTLDNRLLFSIDSSLKKGSAHQSRIFLDFCANIEQIWISTTRRIINLPDFIKWICFERLCSSANVSALSLQLPSCHLRPGPQATIYF